MLYLNSFVCTYVRIYKYVFKISFAFRQSDHANKLKFALLNSTSIYACTRTSMQL